MVGEWKRRIEIETAPSMGPPASDTAVVESAAVVESKSWVERQARVQTRERAREIAQAVVGCIYGTATKHGSTAVGTASRSSRVRMLRENLREPTNGELRRRVLSGELGLCLPAQSMPRETRPEHGHDGMAWHDHEHEHVRMTLAP